MNILLLSTRLPHAQVVSGHLIVYQRIDRLARRGHRIGLAAFARPDDAAHTPVLRDRLHDLRLVPSPLQRRVTGGLPGVRPPVFAAYYSKDMLRAVGEMVGRSRYEVVLAEFGLMGQHLYRNPYLPAVRKVISVHQCHTLAAQRAWSLRTGIFRRSGEGGRHRRLQAYEFAMYRCADHILTLSPEVRFGMLEWAPELRVTVIPSGVDTAYYRPAQPSLKEPALLFTGYFTDEPNRDAAAWFVETVWPRLAARHPELVFYIVGPHPSETMIEWSRRDPRVVVTGEVDDIRPYLARARVFVCPTRMGSGMKGKILQAMAAGVPVVSTTLGAEGIPVQMGDTGFLADTPEIMAQYVNLLLEDEPLQTRLAEKARALVSERFSWDRGIEVLERILQDTVS